MKLDSVTVERIREHLGYNAPRGIPVGAESQFQTAINNIYSSSSITGKGGILYWLDRCDRGLTASDPTNSEAYAQRQLILGDVNRSTTTLSSRDIDYWWELYLKQCDQLAFKLNVPNLQRPDQAAWAFVRMGNDYVLAPNGPPDTAISDRLWLSANWV